MFSCPRCRKLFQTLVLATACTCAAARGDSSHLESKPIQPKYEYRIQMMGTSTTTASSSGPVFWFPSRLGP
jgi:hypothetical protein